MPTQMFAPRACTGCGVHHASPTGYLPEKRGRDGYSRRCRECLATQNRELRHARIAARGGRWETLHRDPDKYKAQQYAWREANRERTREIRRKSVYGIEPADYQDLLDASGGLCAICRQDMGTKICIDHDHASGKVRGLLCHNCNVGIGHLRDDVALVRAALDYLIATL